MHDAFFSLKMLWSEYLLIQTAKSARLFSAWCNFLALQPRSSKDVSSSYQVGLTATQVTGWSRVGRRVGGSSGFTVN